MSAYSDAEWNEEVRELEVEIARLQRERDQIELDLIQMAEQCERLRAALEEYANEENWRYGRKFDPNTGNFKGIKFAVQALANEEGKMMEPLFDKTEIIAAFAVALKNGAPGLSDDLRAAIIRSALIRLEGARKAPSNQDAILDQLRKLFAHIEGINDERDSVPILLEARRILREGK